MTVGRTRCCHASLIGSLVGPGLFVESQAVRLRALAERWYGPPPAFFELVPNDDQECLESPGKDGLKSSFPYKYYMDLVKVANNAVDAPEAVEEAERSARKKIEVL